ERHLAWSAHVGSPTSAPPLHVRAILQFSTNGAPAGTNRTDGASGRGPRRGRRRSPVLRSDPALAGRGRSVGCRERLDADRRGGRRSRTFPSGASPAGGAGGTPPPDRHGGGGPAPARSVRCHPPPGCASRDGDGDGRRRRGRRGFAAAVLAGGARARGELRRLAARPRGSGRRRATRSRHPGATARGEETSSPSSSARAAHERAPPLTGGRVPVVLARLGREAAPFARRVVVGVGRLLGGAVGLGDVAEVDADAGPG